MTRPSFFTIGFIFLFFVILEVLFLLYIFFVRKDFSEEILTYVYGSIIFLFVLFGIIVISLFYRAHEKDKPVK